MHEVIDRLRRIAPTDATVLIQGETGTGKELVAQAIHQNSPRKNRPFVALNCAALSEHILESELFGHIRGAFTDASADRVGKFEYANGGTLFLDEVGDMPLATQIKLLRVLESGEITRVGSNEPIKVNVRILSATNRDLEDAIRGRHVPRGPVSPAQGGHGHAAAAGRADAGHSAADRALHSSSTPRGTTRRSSSMTTAARRRLMAYDWPGNVRQLQERRSRAWSSSTSTKCSTSTTCRRSWRRRASRRRRSATGDGIGELVGQPLEDIERLFIAETLKATGGNREEAASMLGIGERTLYRKIKEYGLN